MAWGVGDHIAWKEKGGADGIERRTGTIMRDYDTFVIVWPDQGEVRAAPWYRWMHGGIVIPRRCLNSERRIAPQPIPDRRRSEGTSKGVARKNSVGVL